jgi:hypothetical protein
MKISKLKKDQKATGKKLGKNNAKGMGLRSRKLPKAKNIVKKKKATQEEPSPEFHPNPVQAMNAKKAQNRLAKLKKESSLLKANLERVYFSPTYYIQFCSQRTDPLRPSLVVLRFSRYTPRNRRYASCMKSG